MQVLDSPAFYYSFGDFQKLPETANTKQTLNPPIYPSISLQAGLTSSTSISA